MYSAGTAYLTVVPSFRGIERALQREAEQIGRQVDHSISQAIPNGVREGMSRAERDVDRAGKRAGERYAGAFSESMRRRLTQAAGAIKDIEIGADTSEVERKLADVRKDLLELRDAVVNVDVDSEFAMLELRRIMERVRELQNEDAQIEVHFNLATALAELEALDQAARQAGNRAGDDFADHFSREVRRRLAATKGKFAEVKIGADSSELDRDIAAIDTILSHVDEKIRIGVGLNEGEVLADIELVEQKLRELSHSHPSVRIRTNALAVLAEVEALTKMFRGQQEEMNRLHAEAAQEDERRDRDRVRLLNDAYNEDERRTRDHQKMVRDAYDENERRDRDHMRLLRDAHAENERFDRDTQRRRGGAFGEQASRRLGGARDSISDIEPHLRTTAAQAEMARLRTELNRLSRVTIDVDMPAAQFMREVGLVEAALKELEGNGVDIPLRANARAALAEIQALNAAAGHAGGDAGDDWGGSFVRSIRERVRTAAATISDIPIGLDTSPAQIDLGELRTRLATLGNVNIGVDMDMGAFMAEVTAIENALVDLELNNSIDIQTRLEAAAARAGLTALHEQINAVDRDDITIDVNTDAAGAGLLMLGETAGISMGRLGSLIALGASVGTILVPAAAVASAAIGAIGIAALAAGAGIGVLVLGLFGVVKAVTALDQYSKDADKSGRNLSQSQARVASAMDSVRGAASNVRTAVRNLAKAEKDATDVVKELSKAREEARRQLEDMAIAVRSNALAQRQARLDEADAKKELDKLLANPRATEAEREQAKITYEERLLQIEDLANKQKRLEMDKADADAKGIEHSDQVKAAQERIASAMERVVSAQESVADSQRALVAANRSLQQAYEGTGVAGGEAMRNLQQAMDGLSPAGQRFARFVFGLKDQFKLIQHAAEESLLPGLQRAIEGLLPYLEPFRRFISSVGTAMGDGFAYAVEQLKQPIWQQFFGYMADTAAPAITGMFKVMGNLLQGVAGILVGLSGFNGPIGNGVLQWSEDFAKWGSTLDSNQGWKNFIQYIKDSWPAVRDFFVNIWVFTKRFIVAAAPIGEVVIGAFAKLFEWMNKLDAGTWTIIIGAIAGVAGALLAVSAVTAIVAGGWTVLIVGAIAALVAGLIWLYQNVEPVRKVMDATWHAIADGWSWLWNQVLKPGWDLLVAGLQIVGEWFDKLNHDFISPFFEAVGSAFEIWRGIWDRLWLFIGPIFGFIGDGFRLLGDVVMWLWDHAVKPVFGFMQVGFGVLWAVFQVILGLFQIGMKIFGAVFFWLWDNAVAPVWEKVKPFFSWLGEVIAKYVVPPFKAGMELLGKAWDVLVDAAKVPVRFMVLTVLNDGLLAGYNKIAKFFKVKPDDVHIDLPAGFAVGGAVLGPGTATSDSILARLSNGEHVWTAEEVEAAGGHEQVLRLRKSVLAGMKLDGLLPGFKDGGWWNDTWGKAKDIGGAVLGGIKDFMSDPTGVLKNLLKTLLDAVPGKDTQVMQVMAGLPPRVLDFALDKVKDLFGGDGAGPGFGSWPSSPSAQRGDSGVWRSIVALIRSTGPMSGTFGNAYRPGDPLWHGSGRAVDWMGYRQDALATWLAAHRPLELIHRTPARDYAYTRGVDKGSFNEQLMQEHENHVHIAMDQGGWLEPGYSVIFNGTGAPEPVLTNQQWQDINAIAGTPSGDSGDTYKFEFRDTTLDASRLQAIQDRQAVKARLGRPR